MSRPVTKIRTVLTANRGVYDRVEDALGDAEAKQQGRDRHQDLERVEVHHHPQHLQDVAVGVGEFTVVELAKKVLALTGADGPVDYLPLPADDPVRRKPDITRARQLLGWEPATPLDDGLKRTVDYFRDTLPSGQPMP